MFYSQFILAKKGPLGTIWIAAHLERKLRKNQITETNIIDSVDSILFPEVPIALRLSGHLLLGVVRIYSRKVEYLFHDCSEALIKIKQAFHSSSVDLPPEAATAPFHSVTLPETYDFDELESYLSRDQAFKGANGVAMDHHVTARDLITLQDRGEERAHFGALFTLDERFPEGSNPYSVLDFDEESVPHKLQAQAQSKVAPLLHEMAVPILEEDVLPPLPMEDEMDLPIMDIEKNHEELTPEPEVVRMDVDDMYGIPQELPVKDSIQQYASTTQVTGSALPQVAGPLPNLAPQSDTEMAPGVAPEVPEVEKLRSAVGPAEEDVFLTALENEIDMGKERTDFENISQEHRTIQVVERRSKFAEDTPVLQEETPLPSPPSPTSFRSSGRDALGGDDVLRSILGGRRSPALKVMETPAETPVKPKPGRRKRKPAFDDVVALSSYYMKKQLTNVEDLRRVRRKAPCTEYDIWRVQRESHVEQKFSGPCIPGLGIVLRRLYDRVFVSKMKLPAAKLSQKSTPKDVPSKIQPDQTEESLATDILTPIADAYPFMTLNIEDVLREQVDGAQPNDEVQASLPRKIAELTQGKEKLQIPSVQEGDIQLHRPPTPTVLDIEPPLLLVDLPVEEEQHAIFEQTDKGMDLQEVEIEAGENGVEIDAFPMEDGAEIVRDEPDKVHETTADFDIERQVEAAGSQAGTKTPHTLASGSSFEEQSQKSLGFLADSNDTVYFVADEDGVFEDLDYHSKRALIQDSGGWSARTRGVAQYLKTAFEKLEAKSKSEIHQPACLSLDGLLKGRTRKESARMFFETLVLKSKDYIQVKQDGSFSDIHLYATPRLLKAVF